MQPFCLWRIPFQVLWLKGNVMTGALPECTFASPRLQQLSLAGVLQPREGLLSAICLACVKVPKPLLCISWPSWHY